MTTGPFRGLRVLDFGRYIAGPFCATLLGDYGADVIRVERIGGGEDRNLYPVSESGDGALFLQMSRNKRAITLDARAPGGREVFEALVKSADVVVANLPGETLRDMGLDYDSLRALRPDIILTAVTAFGPTGPYAGRVGFDGVGQAMSGAVYLSGQPGQPTKAFPSWVDFTSAMLAAVATMAAIHERSRTGQGQEVQGSLLGAALTVMNFPLIEQALTGVDREATGNRAQSGGPADAFQTRDGWIMIQVIGDPLFKRWTRLIGEPQWLEDPRFASDSLRSDNGTLLSERTARWAAALTTAEALAALAAAKVPGGPILSPRQALDDPHVQQSGLMTMMDFPGADRPAPLTMTGATLSATPATLRRRAPLLDEHTVEVLLELGFDAARIRQLNANGAVGVSD
ncbi:MAG: L-carnitine dehydratase/bile acid-inducible protein [Caulobacter sp.]|nr:L-carnitine dehydratase/bile acid-inducible protein [Caulobacter sp.]